MSAEPAAASRVLIEIAVDRKRESAALRAFLNAANLLGLAVGKVIAEYRSHEDPLVSVAGTVAELRVQLAAANAKIDILQERLDKLPPRARPHHSPRRRFDILEVKAVLRESASTTAEWARVTVSTVLRWEKEAGEHPERTTVGSLLKPTPPVRRYADAERRLVQWMGRMGFPGGGSISKALIRVGRRIAPRTIQRMQKEKPQLAPPPLYARSRVEGRYPNHVWIADETEIPALFRIFSFKLLLIIDAFSRFPVAARLSIKKSTAAQLVDLFRCAARKHGMPRHFVSDKGRPFRTRRFARELKRSCVQQRSGRSVSMARSRSSKGSSRLSSTTSASDCLHPLACRCRATAEPHPGVLRVLPASPVPRRRHAGRAVLPNPAACLRGPTSPRPARRAH
jgi:hypothetical protein